MKTRNNRYSKYTGIIFMLLAVCLYPFSMIAQVNAQTPGEFAEVGIDEHYGDKIPLDLTLATAEGDSVTLGSLLEEGKPILLNPVYYNCPMLCTMVIDAVFNSVKKISWTPGNEYNIITFSIDPDEDYKLAASVKDSIMSQMSRKDAGKGWYFLTGNQPAITQLTQAIGFNYKELVDKNEFAHTASIMFLSPEGVITRYLYGLKYEPFSVRNALYEAADGEIGSTLDKIILYCYVYNPDSNSYTAEATRIMRVGGILTLTALTIFLGFMWFGRKLFNNKKKRNGSA